MRSLQQLTDNNMLVKHIFNSNIDTSTSLDNSLCEQDKVVFKHFVHQRQVLGM